MENIRLKDGEDEHDDEEEDVGREDGHLIDALLRFFTDVLSVCEKGRKMVMS